MIFLNFNKKYKIIKKKIIVKLLKKIFFIKKNINLNFINLLDSFIINKIYKKKIYSTNILIFNNNIYKKKNYDFYICNIILESESIILKKKLNFIYIFLIIHGIIHGQKFNHKKYFLKKNIFNFLEFKFYKKLGFKYNFNFLKYKKYIL